MSIYLKGYNPLFETNQFLNNPQSAQFRNVLPEDRSLEYQPGLRAMGEKEFKAMVTDQAHLLANTHVSQIKKYAIYKIKQQPFFS